MSLANQIANRIATDSFSKCKTAQCLPHELTSYVTNLCSFNNQSRRRQPTRYYCWRRSILPSSYSTFTPQEALTSLLWKQARPTWNFTQHTMPRMYVSIRITGTAFFWKSDLQSKIEPSEILAYTPVWEISGGLDHRSKSTSLRREHTAARQAAAGGRPPRCSVLTNHLQRMHSFFW